MHKLRQDLHTLAGPYVMDALPPDDLRTFEEHLLRCDACVQEVRGLAETTALLGSAAAQSPPAGLRERVLRQVSQTRQLPPRPAAAEVLPRRWRQRFWFTLAACLVLVLAMSAGLLWQMQYVGELRDREQAIAAVLGAEDSTVSSTRVDGGIVRTVTSRDRGAVVITAEGLRSLDERDYQAWFAAPDGSVRSAGLVPTAEGGAATVLATGVREAEAIAITVEPEGGSEQPTSKPFVSVPLGGSGG